MTGKKRWIGALLSLLCVCFLLFPCVPLAASAEQVSDDALIPGGMAFGIRFYAKGAIVIGIADVETAGGTRSPARDAGLQAGDIITGAGGTEITDADALLAIVKGCGGQKLRLTYLRDGAEKTAELLPVCDRTTNEYRLGVWVRDSTAGIGTITFIDAKTGAFGGLGHGITDAATGQLMPFLKGTVADVRITGVRKGKKNLPGELKGEFGTVTVGVLNSNTEVGVFGRFDTLPAPLSSPLPLGEIRTGKATVRTSASGKVRDYEIEIEELYRGSGDTKNFLIHVTDPALLSLTGGIVQGMSGSPILQNGKLVGAVTHVLLDDPTRGFGIHIMNMLKNSENMA